jgi:hypothetical protein
MMPHFHFRNTPGEACRDRLREAAQGGQLRPSTALCTMPPRSPTPTRGMIETHIDHLLFI